MREKWWVKIRVDYISQHHRNQIDDLPWKYNDNFKNWKGADIKFNRTISSSNRITVTLLGNKTVKSDMSSQVTSKCHVVYESVKK